MFKRINHTAKDAVNIACNILDQGEVIVYPTDTLYGFGCNAKNTAAIEKLNKIKRRTGPMSVIAPNILTALEWMDLPSKDKIKVQSIIGGNTTVIIPVKKNICSEIVIGENNSLGIRIPDHPFCEKISNSYSNPIITTSVNRKGENPLKKPDDIEKEFYCEIELLIEDGDLDGNASTIFLFENGSWTILRK